MVGRLSVLSALFTYDISISDEMGLSRDNTHHKSRSTVSRSFFVTHVGSPLSHT